MKSFIIPSISDLDVSSSAIILLTIVGVTVLLSFNVLQLVISDLVSDLLTIIIIQFINVAFY